MKIVAVLDIDVEKLAETGHNFEEEMAWVEQSGITLSQYQSADKCSKEEYGAFVFNAISQEYERVNGPFRSETMCRLRFEEYAKKGWLPENYDTEKVIFKKRTETVLKSSWEEIQ